MKKAPQSYSSAITLGAAGKNFVVPTSSQMVLYMLISVVLLTILNLGRLWDYLNNNILSAEGGLGGLINQNASGLNKLINSFSQSIILQVVFWVCIGSLIYVLIWFIRNIVINILNDVVADSYVHPKSYNRFRYWESVIARKIIFGVSLTVLLFFLLASWRLVTSLAGLTYSLFGQINNPHHLLELAGIVLVIMALVHGFILISRVTIHSWRFIYKDL